MMAMPLAPRGRTPFSSDLDRLSSGHGDVICGTGDSFVTSSDPWLNENNIDIVDMNCSRLPMFASAAVISRDLSLCVGGLQRRAIPPQPVDRVSQVIFQAE